ncbi:MAG: formylglycine-generating enzyme family protein [Bacteroidales bacterium]|jgi:formylglycine-generating enzyme required for sulfatase activity|nr:formylglycine-generating enzyme family protein [Bacteroidales bacterium]
MVLLKRMISCILFQLILISVAFSQKSNTKDISKTKKCNFEFPYEMVYVKGGSFMMGCIPDKDPDCYSVEKPLHKVKLNSFYMGKTEVLQQQWKSVMGYNNSYYSSCDSCPVDNVSWIEIQYFIKKLDSLTGKKFRLPTEAEWEYAARGGASSGGYIFSGSDERKEVGWYYLNSGDSTHCPCSLKANELGICDMSGNLWEWCSDWHDGAYYSYSPKKNPQGPVNGTEKIVRGGSWMSGYGSIRCSARAWYLPVYHNANIGFRLCMSKK